MLKSPKSKKPQFLDREALASRLGVSYRTICRLEKAGLPRLPIRPAGKAVYDLAAVIAWMQQPASSAQRTA